MIVRLNRVSLLVDSDPAYGRGHLSRCLLLAEALAEQSANCRFLLTKPTEMPGLAKFPVTILGPDLPQPGDIVVVDGYRFEPNFLERLKMGSPRLVVIDDLGDRAFPSHAILNHNLYAESLSYAQHRSVALFLGPRYALVRKDFFRLRALPPVRNGVLITLGSGPDAQRGIELALELQCHLDLDIDVVLGAGSTLPDKSMYDRIQFHDWADLAELAKRASLVICGLGVTFLEILATGKSVIGVQVAANQALAYQTAKKAGYLVFEHLDPPGLARAALAAACEPAVAPAKPFQLDSSGPARAAAAVLGKED